MSFYHVSRARIAFSCLSLLLVLSFAQSSFAQLRFETPQEPAADLGRRWPLNAAGFTSRSAGAEFAGEVDPAFAPQFDQAYGFAYSAETQADGKLVVAGGFKSINGYATESIVRFNADRSIDTTFRGSIRGSIQKLIIQPDGKILIGGSFTAYNSTTIRPGIARLNSDGSLDTTFDPGTGPGGLVRDILLQPDGKVIVTGDFLGINGTPNRAIARLNSDGSVDETFNSPITPSPSTLTVNISGVALRQDGKLVVTGPMHLGFQTQVYWVLRLNPNGSPDNSFTPPSMSSNAWKVAVQPDNKIILAGFFTTVAGQSRPRVTRLNEDGSLDMTFNPGTGANASALSVRVLSNGKIAVTGTFNSYNGTPRGGVAILNPDGSLDTTFAPSGTSAGSIYNILPVAGGYVVNGSFTRISGADKDTLVHMSAEGTVDPTFSGTSLQYASVRTVIHQAGGKLLVGGLFNRINGAAVNSVVRLNSDGSIDPTFASGVSIQGFVDNLVTQPDGKLLVLGSSIRINNGTPAAIVRLNADGTLDSNFALLGVPAPAVLAGITAAVQPDGGILFSYQTNSADPIQSFKFVRLDSGGLYDSAFGTIPRQVESIAVLPDGKILAAGPFAFSYVNSTTGTVEPHNGVMRLNSDGSHDRTFRSALTTDQNAFTAAYAMHVQADGKILIGGRLFAGGSTTPFGVVRLNATGTIDGSFQTSTISSTLGLAHVYSLHETIHGKILAAGAFDTYGTATGIGVVRLDQNGVRDPAFAAFADNSIWTVTTDSLGRVVIGGTFTKVNGATRAGLARLLSEPPTVGSTPFDFDGDGKADIGIFRPTAGASEWWINRSGNGQTFALQFGTPTDVIVPADYTGDGRTDIAFFRPASGEWYVLRSEDFSFFALPFGANGDVPVPADYDADGKADFAVFRPSSSTWFISQSSGAPTRILQFGSTGDVPVVADYDNDSKADVGIFRQAAGGAEWWIDRSTAGLLAMQFGANTDKPVQADYTGDGKADVAIWRPATGEWLIVRSENFSFFGFPFGTTGDVVAPADYDGDGKADPTVFRPSSATWFVGRTTGGTQIVQFGATGDRPLPNAFVP